MKKYQFLYKNILKKYIVNDKVNAIRKIAKLKLERGVNIKKL